MVSKQLRVFQKVAFQNILLNFKDVDCKYHKLKLVNILHTISFISKMAKARTSFQVTKHKQKIVWEVVFCLSVYDGLLRDNVGMSVPKSIKSRGEGVCITHAFWLLDDMQNCCDCATVAEHASVASALRYLGVQLESALLKLHSARWVYSILHHFSYRFLLPDLWQAFALRSRICGGVLHTLHMLSINLSQCSAFVPIPSSLSGHTCDTNLRNDKDAQFSSIIIVVRLLQN